MSADNGTESDVIACRLGERERAERALELRQELFAGVLAIDDLPDGYGYRFPADDDWTAKVLAFVAAERACCPFFTFEVVFEPHGQGVWLRLRGSEAIKAFVRDSFPLILREAGATQ
jgi:hypothetical protein